ncbi:hypothetical protein C8F04DRAFT_877586, partial [Mycena alexandri]
QLVAAVATVELPVGHWGNLIKILLGFIDTLNLRIATLQTIVICDSNGAFFLKPKILTPKANEILTAAIHGAHKKECLTRGPAHVVIYALYSLQFVCENF